MSSQQDIWDYATAVFSLPAIPVKDVSNILGVANIDALSASASATVTEAVKHLDKVQKVAEKNEKQNLTSPLLVEEIRAEGAQSQLIKRNMEKLVEVLGQLRVKSTENKFVLPQFRGVKHFEIGDEIMINVGSSNDDRKTVEYDWISAKMLCPGWDWVMHCHSNTPWTRGGSNGGHYFRVTDQSMLFKRADFYGLRRMLQEGEDVAFTDLLTAKLAKKVCEGSVEPLTGEELESNQASYIERAKKVVDFYAQHIPIIATRYGVAA